MASDLAAGMLATLVAAMILGSFLAITPRGQGWLDRVLRLAAPPLLAVAVWACVVSIVVRPAMTSWSGVRLAPIAGFLRGYPLYPSESSGPVNGWIYPPISALAYAPTAWLAEPWRAILGGRLLSLVFVFGPVALALAAERRRRALSTAGVVLLFAVFLGLTQQSKPLRYISTEILADAPALGLLALTVFLSSRIAGPRGVWFGLLAMFTATLAAWSKQLEVGLLLVPFGAGILGLRSGSRRWFVAGSLLIVASVSLLIVLGFGFRDLVFQLVELPRRHPFRTSRWSGFVELLRDARGDELTLAALCGVATVLMAVVPRRSEDRGQERPSSSVWRFGLAAAVVEAPLALLGFVKVGGDVNSLAHFLFPWALAALFLYGELLARWRPLGWLVLAAGLVLGGTQLQETTDLLRGVSGTGRTDYARVRTWIDEERRLAAFERAHPGLVYFPTYPLTALLVNGRLAHAEYGVFDRSLADLPLDESALRRGIPSRARYLCYPGGLSFTVPGHFLKRALPEFSRPVRLDELPFCECYEREP